MSFRECFKRGIEKLCSTEPDYVPCPSLPTAKILFFLFFYALPHFFFPVCVCSQKRYGADGVV